MQLSAAGFLGNWHGRCLVIRSVTRIQQSKEFAMNVMSVLNPAVGLAGVMALALSATMAFAEVKKP